MEEGRGIRLANTGISKLLLTTTVRS